MNDSSIGLLKLGMAILLITIQKSSYSQNVGIGTSSPMTRLHIMGGGDAAYSTPSGYLIIGNVGLSNLIFDNNEILARNAGASSPLYLNNNGGNIILGSSGSGNVGINFGSPTERLHIGAGNIRLDNAPLGINLNAVDRPLITRRFDAFTSGNYQGLGRWGLFMEPSKLTAGFPYAAGKGFAVSAYNANSTVNKKILEITVDNDGINTNIQMNSPVDINGRLTNKARTGDIHNLIPVAYGFVQQGFSTIEIKYGSTNNFTVTQNTVGRYNILIDNDPWVFANGIVIVTPLHTVINSGSTYLPVFATVSRASGIIALFDKDNNPTNASFQFVVYSAFD